MVLAMMHCAGLYGLLAFVSSVVIAQPTPLPSRLSLSLSLRMRDCSFGNDALRITIQGFHRLSMHMDIPPPYITLSPTRPSQAFLSSVVIAEPTPPPPA